MSVLFPSIDPDGLLEYSVVFTDRSLNHMSQSFQGVMNDVSTTLKKVYNAKSVVIVPGGGTFSMEAVARQFTTNKRCLVIRNGWFSFRWTQIFDAGNIPSKSTVLKASRVDDSKHAAFAPAPVEEVVAVIETKKPDVVFAPHVETASGIMLPDDYVRAVADAVHSSGGLFVLDCIASGSIWVDMEACGVVVSYTDDPDIQNGKKFLGVGMQIAAGVPLQCDEPEDFKTFRLGLFGLDKLHNVDRTVERLNEALNRIL